MRTRPFRAPREFEDVIDLKLNEYLEFKGIPEMRTQRGIKSWFILNKLTPHIRMIQFTNTIDNQPMPKRKRGSRIVARY